MSGLSFGDFSFPQFRRPPPPLRTFINHASINLTEYYIGTLDIVNTDVGIFGKIRKNVRFASPAFKSLYFVEYCAGFKIRDSCLGRNVCA